MSSKDIPKWKLEGCNCWVDTFRYHKVCTKHQAEFDELHARAVADKKLQDEWNERLALTDPSPNHSRHGTFEYMGGPITWAPYVAPPLAPESKVEGGDLTSLM